jgi:hypothetical protein
MQISIVHTEVGGATLIINGSDAERLVRVLKKLIPSERRADGVAPDIGFSPA